HHVTHVVLRGHYFNFHDRLEQNGTAFLGQLLGGHGSGDLERHFVRVDIMIRTIKDGCLEAEQRVTGENTVLHLLINALLYRRNVFLGYHTTNHFAGEHQAFDAFFGRLEADPDMTELTATTRLTNELAFDLAGVADSFTVSHLGLADVGLDVELTLHTINDDVQVQLTHTTDDGLTGLFVGAHAERGVFLSQLAQSDTHLLLVSLGFRLDRYVDNRLGEIHARQNDGLLDGTQGVTGGHILHADQRSDVTGAQLLELFTAVSLHLNHTADALFLALDRVEHRVTGAQHTGVHAYEGQGTDEGVGGNLERQSSERLVITGNTLISDLIAIRADTLDGLNFVRSRQKVDHRVQHQRHTLVLERGATDSRDDLAGQSTLTQAGLDPFQRQVALFQMLVHQLFVGFGGGLDQIFTVLLSQLGHVLGNLFLTEGHAQIIVVPVDGLHAQQVDLADEVFFGTDRQLQRHRGVTQALLDLLDHAQEVGALTVQLVYVDDTRHAVLVGLTPYGFRLGLYTRGATEHNHGAVQHTQGTLNFNCEVNVAGGVNYVDTVLLVLLLRTLPESGYSSGGNGDTTLLLLSHPVSGTGTIMGFTHFVVHASVIQDPLRGCGFARVDVRTNTDISVQIDRGCTSHDSLLSRCLEAIV